MRPATPSDELSLIFRPASARRSWLIALLLASLAAAARANITVDVTGVEGPLRDNVLAYLSLQRYAKRDDLDSAIIERLFLRANDEAKSALRPFGYYEPHVRSQLIPEGTSWRVRLRIEPGAAIVLASSEIKVIGPGEGEAAFRKVIEQSNLASGTRLNHADYEHTKSELQRTAVAIGYLDARLVQSEMLVSPAKHSAIITLKLDTGPRYHFGKTTIEQDVIDPKLFVRYLRYKEGAQFDAFAVLWTQFALDDTQYFSVVEVTPGDRDRQALSVPMRIRAQAAQRNHYTIGAGYGTDTKWRGILGWDDRLINRAGHRSRVQIKASSVKREITGQYLIPVGDPALEKVSLDAKIGTEQLADADTETVEVRPGLTQVLGRWQRVLFVRLTHTITTTPTDSSTANLVIPGISFAPLPDRSFTQPVIGRGFYAELTGSHQALGSDANYLRLDVQDEKTFNLRPKWHFIARGELGLSLIGDFSELPASERFFAGGDNSVRGFALNELSPVDANGDKTGGRYLIVASAEIERELPKQFAVAAFVDAGNAMNSLGDPLEYSVGVGVRYRISVLSVGFDVAQPLSENRGPRLHLNITPIFK